jgi:small subunit ribosomal protein S11
MGKKKVTTQAGDETAKKAAGGSVAGATAGAADGAVAVAKKVGGKKGKKVQAGRAYVNASYNNTVVTITDMGGNVLAWASAGSLGFGGPRKATPFAAQKIIAALAEKLQGNGPIDVEIIVKGIGSGRDSAIRSLINHGFNILSIKDATPIPFNGPRAKKVRRV